MVMRVPPKMILAHKTEAKTVDIVLAGRLDVRNLKFRSRIQV
jgi:hypothetical protein